ncbi:hypothetical protein [Photorhabdus tasmaniensis]|uniref:Phage protein n=1 Tax=Photorhabdus tasmaniensis TaxID=1004159 RepID=A0ABX0GN10_9GAMM|nr:hypothetical protein [Photorhabdus tasmaniensis]NHB89214.1 hypothetical protein [Photorhabdus tasmaniensis]
MNSFHELTTELLNRDCTTVDLIFFQKNRDERTTESRYFIRHSNDKTILEQSMVINGSQYGYVAQAIITDFPLLETEKAAALKLADWLRRMAEAIEEGFGEKR